MNDFIWIRYDEPQLIDFAQKLLKELMERRDLEFTRSSEEFQ